MSSASGTEAAEVLACWSTVTITLRRIEAELPRGGVEDALVGLVRHHPVDLVGAVAGRLEHLVEHVGEVDDRVAEHLLALHPQLADRAGGRDAAVDIEQVVVAAVGVEPGGEDAAILGVLGLQHDRAGAVAEQDAGRRGPPSRGSG